MKVVITPRFHESGPDQLLAIEKKYYYFFDKFNCHIHLVPFSGISMDEYLEREKPDAVVFAGGYRLYTEEISKFETKFLDIVLKKKIPILAICCGMWTVNSFFGGNLKWTENHQCFDGKKIDITKMIHYVKATDLIEKKNYKVNSFHAKSLNNIGDSLKPFLISDEDNIIEGIYNIEKKIIGVQFHMENTGVTEELTQNIMNKFLNL
jgi:gamma-glutamyl-gamma-aminobutyrate hydrolase PuuD